MKMIQIFWLVCAYMGIGLFLGVMYCSDNTSNNTAVKFFYNRLNGWCERNDISYSILMVVYGIFLWPTIILHMIYRVLSVLWMFLSLMGETVYKAVRALIMRT